MAEEIKRKRGRPRKKSVVPAVNENLSTLQMEHPLVEGRAVQQTPIPNLVSGSNMHDKMTQCYGQQYGSSKNLTGFNAWNPMLANSRLKGLNTLPGDFKKADIIQALSNPQNNELTLRKLSWGLSSESYLYYQILRESCDIPLYCLNKIPEFLDPEEYKEKDFIAEDIFVDNWLSEFNVKQLFKKIALQVKREGKRSYVLRNQIETIDGVRKTAFATLQELPSDWVKITGISKYGYEVSFDFSYFLNPANTLDAYPAFFTELWNCLLSNGVYYQNKGGPYAFDSQIASSLSSLTVQGHTIHPLLESRGKKFAYWITLPAETTFTFASDDSHPWVVPDTASIFVTLQSLSDYQTLAGLIASTPLSAVLTGECDFEKDAKAGDDAALMSPDSLIALQNYFNSITSTNTEAFFAPLKNLKLQNLTNNVNSNDILTGAMQNFVSMTGKAGIIPVTDKPSIAQIKSSQKTIAEEQHYVTLQFERILNHIVNDLIGTKYQWKIQLFGNIFSIDDLRKYYKELVQGGNIALLPKLMACENITMRETQAIINYVESLGIYSKFSTLTMEKQSELNINASKVAAIGSEEQSTGAGRPQKSEDDIESDATAQSRERGDDISENKSVYDAISNHKCCTCGADIEDGQVICQDCLEKVELEKI